MAAKPAHLTFTRLRSLACNTEISLIDDTVGNICKVAFSLPLPLSFSFEHTQINHNYSDTIYCHCHQQRPAQQAPPAHWLILQSQCRLLSRQSAFAWRYLCACVFLALYRYAFAIEFVLAFGFTFAILALNGSLALALKCVCACARWERWSLLANYDIRALADCAAHIRTHKQTHTHTHANWKCLFVQALSLALKLDCSLAPLHLSSY